ncbi:MAG: ATP-binding cassette domain-containing protein, partial [Alphaproteobacteria bacterium]|nr:ATP-binding cassette domain-containing protein [Alphaproteobacteria bacterium]
EEAALEARIEVDILDFLDLGDVRDAPISALPYGMQKRVELARALASQPRILLLDEPIAGMNHEEIGEMVRYVREIKRQWNMTILLVEHDMTVVMDISDKVVVVNFGEKIAEGGTAEVQSDARVIEAYLGTGAGASTAGRETAAAGNGRQNG